MEVACVEPPRRWFGFQREGLLRRHYRRRNGELWDTVVMGLPL